MGCGSSNSSNSTPVRRFHLPAVTPLLIPHNTSVYTPVLPITNHADFVDSDDDPPSYEPQLSRHVSHILVEPDSDDFQLYSAPYDVTPPEPSSPPPPYTVLPDDHCVSGPLWPSIWSSNHDGSALSPDEISRHNQNHAFSYTSYWKVWKGKVYDTCALYNHFRPKIEALIELDASLANKRWRLEKNPKHIIINLPSCGIKKVERNHVMETYLVANLRNISATKKQEKWTRDLSELKNSLSESGDQAGRDVRIICERELSRMHNNTTAEDISNESYFRLPCGVQDDNLRKYLNNRKTFNFDIDEHGYAWTPPIEKQNLIGDHICLKEYLRVWLDNWQCFALAIDGEASWEVIPLDIAKNDQTTQLQEEIHMSRAQRSDLWNIDSMEHRRDSIADYFVFTYGYDRLYIAGFLQWSRIMEMSAIHFKRLSEEHF
ncbi:hypothetical protein CAPTEDRAFT_189647 [Capitella teleta]|uniref:Uncharacterized protein n=1 Tax=Capitella teleta TaxID=283909 RepID=R7T695_CAPTE|nr:hypothetical protein CAPTEDRAFT_189647 [Capitella teleta]|eukprot:ELT88788.1 hypothetical protein CAPTEDRAFT_189647 [Capitella teleta]